VVGDSSLARAAERALDKLMAALPRSLQEQAASMKKRLHVDTTGWSGVPEDLAMLPVVQDAVSRDRRLSLRYWPRGRGVTERVVDPLGLVAKGGTWYLVAHTALGFRTFRVSRIEEARLLDQSFERPPGFDLATYWQASTTELREGRGRYEAVLRLHPDVPEWCQKWRAGALGPPSREEGYLGWVATRVTFDDEAQAVFMALGLGARAQVLEPPALRRKVRAGHAEALAAQPSDDR
jgi:predicted DNA-binding transcriptional regulator YafY